jgi:hypothetical protein
VTRRLSAADNIAASTHDVEHAFSRGRYDDHSRCD